MADRLTQLQDTINQVIIFIDYLLKVCCNNKKINFNFNQLEIIAS